MERSPYDAFTARVVERLGSHPSVVGLVALGSTAGVDRDPDEWSDHDLWVVTSDGEATELRDHSDWLPDRDRVVVHFPETEHGRTAIYDDGHVVEYAVFELRELDVAATNAYRVLLDRADVAARLAAIAHRTAARLERRVADTALADLGGRFLTQLTVGSKRWARGERLSANDLVRHRAVESLVLMLATQHPHPALDGLDPSRRVERAHPEVAAAIDGILTMPTIDAAAALLDLAQAHGTLDATGVAAVRAVIERAAATT